MPSINISVKRKIAKQTDRTRYVCGNSDFIIAFDFDAEWQDFETKTARFRHSGKYTEVIFTGNECEVPVITDTNDFEIGVFAGDLHTSTPAMVLCEKSILCDDGVPADPPADVYNQIMEQLNKISGGNVSPEAVQKIVDDYLKANPPAAGKDGADGKDGLTPTIGSNGNWYLGSVDTGKPSRGAKGDKGDAGSIGPKGADGATPDIQIGTVTTLPAGSDATASMGGTAESPLLNLGIPKGADGQGGGSGGSETWELIKSITVPDGAEESTALTISADESGNAFSLKKARLYAIFPAYTGAAKPPTYSFFMLNGTGSGANAPYCYTSGWATPVSSTQRACSIDVDLTFPGLQCERVSRSNGTTGIDYFGPAIISAVTSIGGVQMLIYPGCKFWLYGVRS